MRSSKALSGLPCNPLASEHHPLALPPLGGRRDGPGSRSRWRRRTRAVQLFTTLPAPLGLPAVAMVASHLRCAACFGGRRAPCSLGPPFELPAGQRRSLSRQRCASIYRAAAPRRPAGRHRWVPMTSEARCVAAAGTSRAPPACNWGWPSADSAPLSRPRRASVHRAGDPLLPAGRHRWAHMTSEARRAAAAAAPRAPAARGPWPTSRRHPPSGPRRPRRPVFVPSTSRVGKHCL
jgi:hypothetical protein